MPETDHYCLPVKREVIEDAFTGKSSLEFITDVVELSAEKEKLYIKDLSKDIGTRYSSTQNYMDRFENAGLAEECKTSEHRAYRLNPEAIALANHYSENGYEVFREVWSKKNKLISELRSNGGKAKTSDLNETYPPSIINALLEEDKLESQALAKGKIVHLPKVEISEEEVLQALKEEV